MATIKHPATAGKPGKVLVVEHAHDVARELYGQLAAIGYQICACAATGEAAINDARAMRPDLVVINPALPGDVGGIDAAEAIDRLLGIPVLFLGAADDPGTIDRALRAHPYAYLTRPYEIVDLYAHIEVALAKGRMDSLARDALQWYAATLRGVADAVIAVDNNARVRFLNPSAENLLGWPLAHAQGQDIDEVLTLRDAAGRRLPSPLRGALSGAPQQAMPAGLLLIAPDGQARPVEDSAAPIHGAQGELLGAVMVLRDTHQRVAAEQQLRQSEERFRNAFDLAPGGMALTTNDGTFVKVNAALGRLLGSDQTELSGRRLEDFADVDAGMAAHLAPLRGGQHPSVQFELRLRAHGAGVWALVSVSLLRHAGNDDGMLFQLHDITERKQAEHRLARLAHHDVLTGLPNRAAISEEIERQIALAHRHGTRLAVVFLDLDYFKQVNDSLGHEAGDDLLRRIGRRLRAAVRESDMVGRLGGDEFVVVLSEITELADIASVAAKMQAACLKPIQLHDQELRMGISLGASLYPDDAKDTRSLLRYADSAMYQAKAEGRNTLQFYRRDMTRGLEYRMRLGASLRRAVEQQQFELHFQPIVALDSLLPHAAEALLRWNHPELGQLSPDAFLSLAEDIGLGRTLAAWVFDTACSAAAAWPDGAAEAPLLAINLSPAQFRDNDLVQLVRRSLDTAGLPPHRLCIEITENLMLGDSQRNRTILEELKALGIRISIDDFGTGYSSLSYLSTFRPKEMKIDRSLIEHLCDNAEHVAIVGAAIAMAKSLQLQVVAEGVENAQQHALLRTMGCDLGQGYWYLRPRPADQFHAWLAGPQPPAPDGVDLADRPA